MAGGLSALRLASSCATEKPLITSAMRQNNPDLGQKQIESGIFFQQHGVRTHTAAMPKLKEKLNWLAEHSGWSIRTIAKATIRYAPPPEAGKAKKGIAQQTIHNAMNGHALRVEAALMVAKTLDVPVDWLFDSEKRWVDLDRQPYWWPPRVDMKSELAVMQKLEDDLGEKSGQKTKRPDPRSSSGGMPTRAQARRKSAS